MANFEKVKLATGEHRGDYIVRRLKEGAKVAEVHAEINAEGRYAGLPGKEWPVGVVYAAQRKLRDATPKPAAKRAAPEEDAPAVREPSTDAEPLPVPAKYEGVLDAEDMAEIQAEAAEIVRKKRREAARKDALLYATQELEREARLADQRGAARGDNVDVYIDLAPAVCVGKARHLMPPAIVLDGHHYIHGTTQRVPRAVAAVLNEQIQRSWQHDRSLSGNHDENAYRRPRAPVVNTDPRVQGIA